MKLGTWFSPLCVGQVLREALLLPGTAARSVGGTPKRRPLGLPGHCCQLSLEVGGMCVCVRACRSGGETRLLLLIPMAHAPRIRTDSFGGDQVHVPHFYSFFLFIL